MRPHQGPREGMVGLWHLMELSMPWQPGPLQGSLSNIVSVYMQLWCGQRGDSPRLPTCLKKTTEKEKQELSDVGKGAAGTSGRGI